jgi:phosphoribosylaminoimidazole-succinocarboxamide synthase
MTQADAVVLQTTIPGVPLPQRGKVRDIYDLGDQLLIVVTDRISAFDVVLPSGIPDKGKVLNQISHYWFQQTHSIITNHALSITSTDFPEIFQKKENPQIEGRSMLVKKCKPLPVECIVRGYLTGSGLKEYQQTGKVSGISLPPRLVEASRLPEPLFTPSTKATQGHDVNISFETMKQILKDNALANQIKDISLKLYQLGRDLAEKKGIIIADTKFEFGLYKGQLLLIDEILTPDSSRFWPLDGYQEGQSQKSFDKQFVRDYLLTLKWDQTPPGPTLPDEVIAKTRLKYIEAYERITGQVFKN